MSDINNTTATVLDFEIPSFYNTYNLTSYGGLKIAIYKSKEKQSYFYTPLILVDWNDFKISLDKLDKSDSEKKDVSIVIQHSDPKVESEIINKIRIAENLPANSGIALNLLPFKFFKIYAKIGKNKIWLNEDDLNNLTPEDSFTTQLTLMHERAYIINGTVSELQYFYENRRTNLLWANLYSDGSAYSTTTISAFATFLNNTENTKKLFGDENIENKTRVESSSSGYGASISLGGFSLGGGSTNSAVTTYQSKQRLFNRTFLSDFFEINKSNMNIIVDGDTTKYSQLIDKFIDKLFENKKKIEVSIDATNQDAIVLMNEQIGNSTLKLGQSKAILKSKPKIDVADNTKVEVPIKGVPVKVDKDLKIKTEDDIEWTLDGTEYIPTNVSLNLFSESNLKDEFSSLAILFNRDAKKNTITPFLYPAVWLAKNENYISNNVTDKDNPIGSILGFAGSKADTPNGWTICDGAIFKVTEYTELFSVIGYKWGKGSDDTEFKLPDFQGQFLRGVDYDRKTDTNVLNRINGENSVGDVGSYQEDSFKNHTHFISLFGSTGGGVDFADPTKIASTDRPVRFNDCETVKLSPTGGLETRPKNAYVNFIIRIK